MRDKRTGKQGSRAGAVLLALSLFALSAYLSSATFPAVVQEGKPTVLAAGLSPFMAYPSSPSIISASIDPLKVRPGDSMLVSAQISDLSGVSSVYADMGGIETISLSSGTAYAGILQAGGWNYG